MVNPLGVCYGFRVFNLSAAINSAIIATPFMVGTALSEPGDIGHDDLAAAGIVIAAVFVVTGVIGHFVGRFRKE